MVNWPNPAIAVRNAVRVMAPENADSWRNPTLFRKIAKQGWCLGFARLLVWG
jgi:hypothetical protein